MDVFKIKAETHTLPHGPFEFVMKLDKFLPITESTGMFSDMNEMTVFLRLSCSEVPHWTRRQFNLLVRS